MLRSVFNTVLSHNSCKGEDIFDFFFWSWKGKILSFKHFFFFFFNTFYSTLFTSAINHASSKFFLSFLSFIASEVGPSPKVPVLSPTHVPYFSTDQTIQKAAKTPKSLQLVLLQLMLIPHCHNKLMEIYLSDWLVFDFCFCCCWMCFFYWPRKSWIFPPPQEPPIDYCFRS